MGTRGLGSLYLRGGVWWCSLWVGGKKHRWSTEVRGGKPGKPPKGAEMFRAAKLLELGRGNMAALVTAPLRFEDVAKILTTRYQAEQRASVESVKHRLKPLRRAFDGWLVRDMTTDHLVAYAVKRRDEDGAAVATINQEMVYWRRGLALAHEAGRLAAIPKVPRLPGAKVRQGFLEDEQLAAILKRLPAHFHELIRFLRITGWREGEGLGLEWRRVDWVGHEVRLDTSKNGEPRSLPFAGYPPVMALLKARLAATEALKTAGRVTPWVFWWGTGKPLSKTGLQKAWKRARIKAGVPWAFIHDLRRTFVREMETAGVPRKVAMTITGHRSETIYRRYAIIAKSDVAAGLSKLAK